MPWWRKRRDDDLDVELQTHLEMAARDRVAHGERPDEAARLARREFGNVAQVKEITREMWGWGSLERFWQDFGYGLRLMRRSPGFTVSAVLSLALGIGANTAMFTVVNSVLLRPLPYRDPDRLVMVYSVGSMGSFTWNDGPFMDPDYLEFRRLSAFSSLAAFGGGEVSVNDANEPMHAQRAQVTPSLFPLLGVQAALGRVFGDDDQASGASVVLLSDAFWRGRYLADPGVVGRVVKIEGVPHTIIGVMPAEFRFPATTDIWVPLELRPNYRGNAMNRVMGRLAPGVSAEQARMEVEALLANVQKGLRQGGGRHARASIVDLRESMVGKVRWLLLVLLGAVGCVILIACTNVANLLMARAGGRGREMSVRASLGASRFRLVRQLLTESIGLAICGGCLGLILANASLPGLLRWVPPDMLPRSGEVRLSFEVLGFTFLLSLLTGFSFGLLPALSSSRAEAVHFDHLRAVRGTTPGERRFRGLLIVVETSLVLVLLIGAGLLLKSFWKLQHVDPGFRPDGLVAMTLLLPERWYPTREARRGFYESLLERIEALPQIADVAAVNLLPFGLMGWAGDFEVDGPANVCSDLIVAKPAVSEGYFRTMGIPLNQGRLFEKTDREGAPPVAVVSESVARACWPGRDPLGQRIRMDDHPMTIVGVVGDVRQRSLEADPVPAIYVPLRQERRNFFLWSMTYVIRSGAIEGRPGSGSAAALREQVHALDPELPIRRIADLDGILSSSIAEPRFRTALLLTFAGLALVLAVVGIYGIVSYEVVRRTAELGIRRALGARGRDVLRLVIGRAAVLVGIGVVVGIAVATTATRALKAFLYAVEPTDLMTFLLVSAGLVFVAFLATLLPARRAMTVDPVVALRHE
jgi:predicted permease